MVFVCDFRLKLASSIVMEGFPMSRSPRRLCSALWRKVTNKERMMRDKVKLRILGSSGNPLRTSKEGSGKVF